MATNFPTSLDTLTNPVSSDAMNSVTVPHADQHANANDAIEALEAKVGADSSIVTTSLDYLSKSVSAYDPGHKHSFLWASSATYLTSAVATLGNLTGTASALFTSTMRVSGSVAIGGSASVANTQLAVVAGVTSSIALSLYGNEAANTSILRLYNNAGTLLTDFNQFGDIAFQGHRMYNTWADIFDGVTVASGGYGYGWSPTGPTGTDDTRISRPSAGTIAVGTGTAYAYDGTVQATNLTAKVNGSTGGLYAGASGDVQFYRNSADVWRTPDSLTIDTTATVTSTLVLGADTQLYRSAAGLIRTPNQLYVEDLTGIGITPQAAVSFAVSKTQTSNASWMVSQNQLTINVAVTGGQSLGALTNIVYISSGLGSGPSNFVTTDTSVVYVQGGTAYCHYAVGGEFSSKTTSARTGGTINFMAGGLFQNWFQSSNAANYNVVLGGRFDCLAIDSAASGIVTDGSAGYFRWGHFVGGSPMAFSSIAGITLFPTQGNGATTNWYGINGLSPTIAGSGNTTNATWLTLGAMQPVTANNQKRIGIDIATMPVSSTFTGTTLVAMRLASGEAKDGIWWGSNTNLYSSAASTLNTDTSFAVGRRVTAAVVTIASGASANTNAALGNHYRLTLGGNSLLMNPTNAVDGQKMTWEITQDNTGSRILTYDSKFAFGSDLTTATLSTSGLKTDFLTAIYNSTTDKFYVVGFVKGY